MMCKFLKPQPGIALAPILMAIALLSVIVGLMSAGANSFGGNVINNDRMVAELRSQIDMIRTKVEECVTVTRTSTGQQFMYPGDDMIDTEIDVVNLTCPRDPTGKQNLWQGARPTSLQPAPRGFTNWTYVNHGDALAYNPGGTCIKIQPTAAMRDDPNVRDALDKVTKRFAPHEFSYNPSDPLQKLIIWIRPARTGGTC